MDGTYVPRILFLGKSEAIHAIYNYSIKLLGNRILFSSLISLDSHGSVDKELMNENRREKSSKYFYQYGINGIE